MKKIICSFFVFLLVCFISGQLCADNKTLYFSSLDWPPYTGEHLPDHGANAIVVRSAFAAMGYELKISFFPWARTVKVAEKDKEYVGYFPEYYAKKLEKDFIFSDPIGNSPLGFVEKKDGPVSWKSLDDLKNITVGTVNEYINTEEFDRKTANGELKVESVVDDSTNLRKVAADRIPLAVIDKYVMQYLMKTRESLKDKKDILQFNSRLLENKKLYLCFRKNAEGEQLVKIFNQGLKKINIERITEDYFRKMLSDSP
ncbi:MAG: amino acid ABC transporter substrate-binding protein [Desulfobacteraceae bacterium]|nr:amino acid ABC transporter substrate-binding protein [Desulfobacteraceae bacterium]